MQAIILAAGKGARLGGTAGEIPKCLLKINESYLIHKQITALRYAGIDDITIVVGFAADIVREICGTDVGYVENPIYDQSNSLYSLWMARHLLSEGFVVMNADVYFHPQLIQDLLTAQHEDALLISYCDGKDELLGDEEMKIQLRRGQVVGISKTLNPLEADGENVGIAKFGASGAKLIIDEMDALVATGFLRQWVPQAFQEFANKRPLHAIGTRGFPWIEIDFPEDYRRAVEEISPRIAALREQASVTPREFVNSEDLRETLLAGVYENG